MRDQSKWIFTLLCFLICGVALLTFEAIAVPADPTASCRRLCRAYGVFRDFQTLLAAGLAFVGAWYAANPVWAQIKKMNIQQDIMARELIVERLKSVENAYKETRELLFAQIMMIIGETNRFDDVGNADTIDITPIAAKASIVVLDTIRQQISSDIARNAGTFRIEAAQESLRAALDRAVECLDRIVTHDVARLEPGFPEPELNKLRIDAGKAQRELQENMKGLEQAGREYRAANDAEIAGIKRRLRAIDDAILAEPKD